MLSNMKAKSLLRERHDLDDGAFAELRIWLVPQRGSTHNYKYALAYIVDGEWVFRYDNEAGKGDHKHVGALELSYDFESPLQLLSDFWFDVDHWRP